MRQSFEELATPAQAAFALPLLREEMARQGLAAFVVPHEDEYQNEFLPAANERLRWVSGFTGSAGIAIVTADHAAIFVDGRYVAQCRAQVDPDHFEVRNLDREDPFDHLLSIGEDGALLGYDPRLHNARAIETLETRAARVGRRLSAVASNPLDLAWGASRPPLPSAPLAIYPLDHAGRSSQEKRDDIGRAIAKAGADAALLTSLASIAWLLNIRGGDIGRTPVAIAQAIAHADGRATLFVDPGKLGNAVRDWLGDEVSLHPPGDLATAFHGLGAVMLDPDQCSAWHVQAVRDAGARVVVAADPCALPRACKNPVEIARCRAAHLRDGVALTRFLHWFDTEGQIRLPDEIEIVERLEACREETGALRDLAFDTIAGAGPNGAIGHYRPTRETNRRVEPGTLLLLDSGGQYLDGTTDVTRTLAVGEAPDELRRRYTFVLKAHLALAAARFPAGTTGLALDAIARRPLWEAGTDFPHGTGHGVGQFLAVHEGPQRIAKIGSLQPFLPGMIVSNEPGNYRGGAFGIRIESLMIVTEASETGLGDRPMHGFEILTLAPLDRRLIVADLLTPGERAQVDAYHAQVAAALCPLLPIEVAGWLADVARPLPAGRN